MTWIRCTADDLKPGMTVKIVENFPSGATITYEGEVGRIFASKDGLRRCEFVGVPPVERPSPPDGWDVKIYRKPRELPMAEGSAILIYDPLTMRRRIAVRRRAGDIIPRGGVEWFWADRDSQVVPDYVLEYEDVDILFDTDEA